MCSSNIDVYTDLLNTYIGDMATAGVRSGQVSTHELNEGWISFIVVYEHMKPRRGGKSSSIPADRRAKATGRSQWRFMAQCQPLRVSLLLTSVKDNQSQ